VISGHAVIITQIADILPVKWSLTQAYLICHLTKSDEE